MKKLDLGINYVSNKVYHSDKSWLSSSSLKKLLKSPAQFKEELENPKEETENPNFIDGSFTHSLILEPELINEEYAFFEGLRKQGKEFEEFKVNNPGKVILSKAQKSRCLAYKRAFDACPPAVNLIQGGEAEHSICVHILDVPIKVRYDYINFEKGYGADVKTSSFPVDLESFRMTMQQYGYGLSAALYLWAAEEHYKKKFDFYFIAISKGESDCQVFKVSEETKLRGKTEVMKALQIYKDCLATNNWPASLEKQEATEHEILEV